jgi:hypothetical protein
MALEKVKTECGSCTGASQTARFTDRASVKTASRKRRRRIDKVEARNGD